MTGRAAPPVSTAGDRAFPYWRISAYYFFYFAGLGAFLPYWALYLESQHFTPEQIGQLMALVAATKIFAPTVWGWLADRTGQGVGLIRLAGLAAAAVAAGFSWVQDFWPLFWVTLIFSFFWNACLPLFEALTLRYLGPAVQRYSQVRLWGSVGFIVAVGVLGYALRSAFSIGCLPLLLWSLLVCLGVISLAVPRAEWTAEGGTDRFWPLLRRQGVLAFFFVVMLLQLSHGPYYVFFSIYLDAHGFDSNEIGLLWALGVIAEIVLFLGVQPLLTRFSLRQILLTSLLLAALRWFLVAYAVEHLMLLVIAQCLHAASFGATHAVGIQLTHRYFGGRHRSKGQGIYSSSSFGLGGALGAWAAGLAWAPLGQETVYAAAAASCLAAWLIAWRWVERGMSSVQACAPHSLR